MLDRATRALIKHGGPFPFLEEPEEFNVHLEVHLGRSPLLWLAFSRVWAVQFGYWRAFPRRLIFFKRISSFFWECHNSRYCSRREHTYKCFLPKK